MEYDDKVKEISYAWVDVMLDKPSKKSKKTFEKELVFFGVSEEDVVNAMYYIRNKEIFDYE